MPSTSPIPPRLVLAEQVLQRLNQAAQGTEVWEDSAVNTNEMLHAGARVCDLRLADIQGGALPEEEPCLFLDKHWQAARGVPADSTFFFVARDAQPNYLTLRTFSRLGYLSLLPRFAHALEGLPLDLSESRSWTWDHDNTTSTGRPTYRRAYVLSVLLKAEMPFWAASWLKNAADDVCTSTDARADRCLFQLGDEAKLPEGALSSYESTREGWLVGCPDTASAEQVAKALFSDCRVQVNARRGRGAAGAELRVALPA